MTVLVIDVGSSSVRTLLFDHHARPVPDAMISHPYRFTTSPPGAATVDAGILRALVEVCIDDILKHPAADTIEAVGMATFVGNILGLDRHGQAATPVYTYADSRSADDVRLLAEQIDQTATHQRTGCPHHTAYQPARLHWLRRTAPAKFESVTQWLDFATYLYREWFGHAACSYSVASWSGLLDRESLQWDADWLEVLGIASVMLPLLADYVTPLAGLQPECAGRWPVLRDVPFFLAVGDGAAANVGSGAVDGSHIALTVGTTAALRLLSDTPRPAVPAGLWGYRLDEDHHLIGGATSEGGNIFRWARQTLILPDQDSVETALLNRPPDVHGLTVLPLLAGERSPGWSDVASGGIVGLRLSSTPLDILQAALEGVALRLSLIADQLKDISDNDITFMAGGGALAASPAWAQIIANALDHPLCILAESEPTARGVAILTLRALGQCVLSDHPPTIYRTLHPQIERVTALRAARKRQIDLYRFITGADDDGAS